ncbi:WcaF family extracellular polysaccharide biosynthesis acetyltransferase [Cyanobium sp. ATX 6F1]|uniref:WcaF family extracellular polysaccharide biosynthesis acetyltransferase n=1 Tax=unclassified Cyanobium TaxID=2627006 RepID=UPI0020CD39A6|nr:WcaF family extracellular polysaccharide biosynthesis acetyltransferase [Cyanobium sp. ATX 6F1]MCP9915817.1 WcaF family extracellular polysaccharide biosynthesis acetyltransferase [Cyanobium sp. ATX 6F1]
MLQDLAAYRLPPDFSVGAPKPVQLLWFCAGSPLLAARWLPGSAWRVALLRAFGARLGRGCRIKPGLRVKYPWQLVVGQACWLGEAVWIDNLALVRLGDRVCLSQGAYLCTGNHDFRQPTFDLLLGPIELGDDVWIGARAVLAPGTRVGAGTVVALAAVASGVLEPGAIYAGHPARLSGPR